MKIPHDPGGAGPLFQTRAFRGRLIPALLLQHTFHLEHHLYPSIPWFNLPKAHALLRSRGALPEDHIYRGYGPILAEVVR